MSRLRVSFAFVLLVAAPLALADVRIATRPDGTKVIYNVDSAGHAKDLDWLARQRNRPSSWDAIIERHAGHHGVDPILVRAVMLVESNYDPASVSRKGARGLMQLMPATASRFNVTAVHDPEQNIRAGVTYLAFLLGLFDHDLRRALAAYNAGENAVIRHGGLPPYAETETYVRRVLTVYHGRPHGSISLVSASGAGRLGGAFKGAVSTPAPIPAAGQMTLLSTGASGLR
ncbi:MAG TPA: lytic transglycosylase domain-containing protein [Thermoanaerobaculia bacterium]|nr:lytic transglycosylase domain-containing protein [Thermoanaerobaculia bacterium]